MFYFIRNVTVVSSSNHGNGNLSIDIKDLNCSGSESHIAACRFHGWGHVECNSGGAVGVICGNCLGDYLLLSKNKMIMIF